MRFIIDVLIIAVVLTVIAGLGAVVTDRSYDPCCPTVYK